MYNVLEAVRTGTPLTAKEKAIHDKGLVSILQQIHDELDAAVLEAYGWQDLKESRHSCRDAEGEKQNGDSSAAHAPSRQECRDSLGEGFEQAILTRLVALNHARAAEEKKGLIRWLRPDYQNPAKPGAAASDGHRPTLQGDLAGTETPKAGKTEKPAAALAWPATLPAQVVAIQKLIATHGQDPEVLSAPFGKKSAKRVQQISEILETLKAIGQL